MIRQRPSVSVLLPCRDAARTLPGCVESLQRQTLERFEVLAVDDGSRDETRSLLEAWAARDPRVRVLAGPGRGPGPACNVAAAAARAPVLARMDADDRARPERLERQLQALDDRRGLAACGTGVRYFPREQVGSGYRRYQRWLNGLVRPGQLRRDLFVECPVAGPTLAIRASAFRSLEGYRDRPWPEDYDLLLRLHRAGLRAANLPAVLLDWRLSPGSLSRRSPAFSQEAFVRCKVHFLVSGFMPPSRPVVVWGAGRVGKRIGRELARRGRRPEAWVDLDPRKIGQEIHGAPVLAPGELESVEDAYVLAAVGSPGARDEIRRALRAAGRRELRDYRAVA